MKTVKRITAVIAVLGLAAAMMAAVNWCIVDDAGYCTRLMMHEFYEQDDIDILFVGASHYAYGIDPAIIAERTGKRVFNASSAQQRMDVSLALVKEALDRYTPEHIYLDMSYGMASLGESYKQRTAYSIWSIYAVSDYMAWSRNKVELLLHATASELYPMSFLVPHNHMAEPFSLAAVLKNLRCKSSTAYKTYDYALAVTELDHYAGNGYISQDTKPEVFFISGEAFKPCAPENIDEDWKTSVREIIRACAAHEVPLTMLNMPVSGYRLLAQTGYDRYIDFLHEFTAGTDVDVVDFNTLDTAFWPDDPALCTDDEHLNDDGAKKFNVLLADHISGTLPNQAFLPSAAARAALLTPDFYGLSYTSDTAEGTLTLRVVAKDPEKMEIWLDCRAANGEQVFAGKTVPGADVTIPLSPRTDITVTWKPAGAPDDAAVTETESLHVEV